MKWYVIYRTTNLVNRRMFYGVHATSDLFYGTPDYSDDFIGKSVELLQDLKKYSRRAFVVEAEHAYTEEAIAWKGLEKILWATGAESSPLYYNKKLELVNTGGYTLSDETKERISIARTGVEMSEETKEKISETKSGTTWINNGVIDKVHIPSEEIPVGWKQGRVFRKRNRKSKHDNNLEE